MPRQIDRAKMQRKLQQRLDKLGKEFGFDDTAYKEAKDKITMLTGTKNVHQNPNTGRITFSLKGIKNENLKSAQSYLTKKIITPTQRYKEIKEVYIKEAERTAKNKGKKPTKKQLAPTKTQLQKFERWKRKTERKLDELITMYYFLHGSDSLYNILGYEWAQNNKKPKSWEDISEAVKKLEDDMKDDWEVRTKNDTISYNELKEELKWL